MHARIRERKGNYYIEIQRYNEGNRKTENISVRKRLKLDRPATEKEAKKLLTEIMYKEDQGLNVNESKIPLRKYIEEWFDLHSHSLKPSRSIATLNLLDFILTHTLERSYCLI